jgi:hypothetical protein
VDEAESAGAPAGVKNARSWLPTQAADSQHPLNAVLQAVLSDLGVLDGKSPREVARVTNSHMQVAAASCGETGGSCNALSPLAFSKLYSMLVMTNARQKLRFKLGLQAEGESWHCW